MYTVETGGEGGTALPHFQTIKENKTGNNMADLGIFSKGEFHY
jgi:hypothetical protein